MCNRHGFCHRDVKLSNLLYPGPASSHGPDRVHLADFGMAARAGRDGLVRGRYTRRLYLFSPYLVSAIKQEAVYLNRGVSVCVELRVASYSVVF